MADLFRKGKSLYSSTTNSFGTGTGETITPSSVAGLPTDTELVLTFDRTVTGKLERIRGHISGGNFVIDERGVDNTSDTSHTSPTVEYIPNAEDMNDLVDGIRVNHTQAGLHDFNGTEVILDADADTTITADTDDQIDIKINNADDFKFTANTFTALSGSTIATNTISETTAASGVTIDSVLLKDGEINLVTGGNIQVNSADPKRGIYVPASAMYPSTTAGCAALTQVESTTNDVNIKVLDFDGAGTDKEYAEFGIPSPSYWDASTITATFYWYATAGSGTVNWEIQGLALSDDDALDTAYGTLQEVTDTLIATGDVHVTAETSAVTVAGTPVAGDWVQFKVARDPNNDTNTSDARLMGVRIRFGVAKYSDE